MKNVKNTNSNSNVFSILKSELEKILETVIPALSSVEMLPVLTMICFNGTHVFAYNDQIGIAVPLRTPFHGAVPGKKMLDLLRATKIRDKPVELLLEDHTLVMKASAKIKLPVIGGQAFVIEMPKPMEKQLKPLPDDQVQLLLASIEHVLLAAGSSDASTPEKLGVTMIEKEGRLLLFGTTGSTIAYASFRLTSGVLMGAGRVTVPTEFCQQLHRLAKTDGGRITLHVDKQSIIAMIGDVQLFGKLIYSERPLDFEKVFREHTSLENDKKLKFAGLPNKMQMVLDRAVIVTGADGGTVVECNGTPNGTAMKFFTASHMGGEVTDIIQLKAGEHAAVKVKIDSRLIRDVVKHFDRFVVTPKSLIMRRSDSDRWFLAATLGR